MSSSSGSAVLMQSGVSSQISREKRGVDDVISEKSHYMTVRRRDGRRN